MKSRYRVSPPPDSTSGWLSSPCGQTPEELVKRWHSERFDAEAKRVEIFCHAVHMFDGDALTLIAADLHRFGQSPDGAETLTV